MNSLRSIADMWCSVESIQQNGWHRCSIVRNANVICIVLQTQMHTYVYEKNFPERAVVILSWKFRNCPNLWHRPRPVFFEQIRCDYCDEFMAPGCPFFPKIKVKRKIVLFSWDRTVIPHIFHHKIIFSSSKMSAVICWMLHLALPCLPWFLTVSLWPENHFCLTWNITNADLVPLFSLFCSNCGLGLLPLQTVWTSWMWIPQIYAATVHTALQYRPNWST